jgi:amidase
LFREWDVVICPVMATPAILHDHSEPVEARTLEIDGTAYPFRDTHLVWSELATSGGLPATVVPTASSRSHLPVGIQIVGPYLEDRTPLRFAQLMVREFGGSERRRAMPRDSLGH